jgi:Fe(3+) dicitrate transport protein
MKKNILLGLCLLATSCIVQAQNASIKGVILSASDSTQMPYVTISVNGSNISPSNNKGEFSIDKMIPGEYKLAFSFIGFEKYNTSVTILNGEQTIILPQIFLTPRIIQLSEVTITVLKGNYTSKYEGSNFVVSSKEMVQTQPVGSEEVLKKIAGVNVSGDMGISNRLNVGIRGSYPRRSANLLLLEDGVPIAPAPYLAPEAYYNPPSDRLDGIEIIKGADILTYGSNTMYGTINYITKKPPLKPTTGINITGGQNGYHSEYITYGGTWNNIGAELQVLNKSFGGFQLNSQSDIFNTTAKVYADLGNRSSVYMKMNYHQENSKATYSALTPFTFNNDPRQNPFDADDLISKRYAADIIHNYAINTHAILSSKVYASQFQRDWWRQENTLIKASTAKTYLGDDIYNRQYSYMDGLSFGSDDYVRVGKVASGRESTKARNRLFRVFGAQETFNYGWSKKDMKNNLEISAKIHTETFNDVEFKNDSSRYSRSGSLIKNQFFTLSAYSGYIKNNFKYKHFSITPTLRYEAVIMQQFDYLEIAKDPKNDGSKLYGSVKNKFNSFIPGTSVAYQFLQKGKNALTIYGGVYKGYNAPTAGVGFLTVENDVVSTTKDASKINMKPEISLNYEAGIRGAVLKEIIEGQVTYFDNRIQNYYSAGREEAFESLGSVRINGIETSISVNLHKWYKSQKHLLTIGVSTSLMKGIILDGLLKDKDLLKAKHTDATKKELIEKINGERKGYNVYFNGAKNSDSLITRELTPADFSSIKKVDLLFGSDGIKSNSIPYLPAQILNFTINYAYRSWQIGGNVNLVGEQYTDYLNFDNETAEGAIGKLSAYKTIDVNLNYSFKNSSKKSVQGLTLFIVGKNITDEVYKASRLHRVSSGIMPGGFRQMNMGLRLNL